MPSISDIRRFDRNLLPTTTVITKCDSPTICNHKLVRPESKSYSN